MENKNEHNTNITSIESKLKEKEVSIKALKANIKEKLRKDAFKYFKNGLTVEEVILDIQTNFDIDIKEQKLYKIIIQELFAEYNRDINKKILNKIKKEEVEKRKLEKIRKIEELKKKSSEYQIYIENNQYYRFVGKDEGKRLTNFLLSINKSIVTKDSDGTESTNYEFYVQGPFPNQDIVLSDEETLDARAFSKAVRRKIPEAFVDIKEEDFAGLRAFVFNAEQNQYTKTIGYTHTGYIFEENKLFFVEENGAFDNTGNFTPKYICTNNKSPYINAMTDVMEITKNELLEVLPLILNINDKKAMITMFGHALFANYSGIAKILFNLGEGDFKNINLYVDGNPSSGKSTITSIVYKICGIKNVENYARKASDTKVAIEHQLASTNSGCCFINELNKRTLSEAKYAGLVDIVKNAYDYLGNSKANIDTNYKTTKQSPVNCPVVTIGQNRFTEDAIDFRGARVSFHSSNKKKKIHSVAFNAIKEKQDLLYKFGKSFKLFMLQNTDLENFKNEYKAIYHDLQKKYANDDRYIRILVTLVHAYKNLEKFLQTYDLTLQEVFNLTIQDIEDYIYKAFVDFCLQGCTTDKDVDVKFLEYINKAAMYSKDKEDAGIIHIPFKRDVDYKVCKRQSVECLAITISGLDKANALIKEWMQTQGIDANHLIDVKAFKSSIVNTEYFTETNVSVKFGKNSVKSMLFYRDKLVMDKIDVDFMLGIDGDVEFIKNRTSIPLSLEEQNQLLRKENAQLQAKIRELEAKLLAKEYENIPF